MPSVSKAQHGAMEAAAHGKSTLGIPKSVGKEFAAADKGRKFVDGGPLSAACFDAGGPLTAASIEAHGTPNLGRVSSGISSPSLGRSAPATMGTTSARATNPMGGTVTPAAPSGGGGVIGSRSWNDTPSLAAGGEVGSVPTLATSSSYAPPPGKRKQGPRNYGKKW